MSLSTSFRNRDVRDALSEVFQDKCYLCEGPTGGGFQVEHFKPKAGFESKIYDWNNLFPAHGDSCNQRRLKWGQRGVTVNGKNVSWPTGGMLDPTGNENIKNRLVQWIDLPSEWISEVQIGFEAADDTDIAAKNTAEELRHLHCHKTSVWAKRLRGNIFRQYTDLSKILNECMLAYRLGDMEMYVKRKTLFKISLSRSGPYSALMRSKFREFIPTELESELIPEYV